MKTQEPMTGITVLSTMSNLETRFGTRVLERVAITAQGFDWAGRNGIGESVYQVNGAWLNEAAVFAAARVVGQ